MATKPIKFLELHYTMTQFLIIYYILCLTSLGLGAGDQCKNITSCNAQVP